MRHFIAFKPPKAPQHHKIMSGFRKSTSDATVTHASRHVLAGAWKRFARTAASCPACLRWAARSTTNL
jgi:hypothetical protein